MQKVLFLGTPEVAVPTLKRLNEECEVVGVVTAPDRPAGRGKQMRKSPVKEVAEELGLEVFTPLRVDEILPEIKKLGAEIAVVVAYGEILSEDFLKSFERGCVNVHFSLLPRWRGASPVQAAILAGDKVTGVMVQKMVKKLDAGDVLLQEERTLDGSETTGQLWKELAEVGADLVVRVVRGEGEAKVQNEEEVTMCGKIEKSEGELKWEEESAEELDRRRRAFDPWPGVWTVWQGERVKVLDSRVSVEDVEPGLVEWRDGRLLVGARKGSLEVLWLQKAGKGAMSAEEFVRGYPDFIGTKLPN